MLGTPEIKLLSLFFTLPLESAKGRRRDDVLSPWCLKYVVVIMKDAAYGVSEDLFREDLYIYPLG